jgi:hypothetical protein
MILYVIILINYNYFHFIVIGPQTIHKKVTI